MEETLALQSERDFLKSVEENSQFLLTTFTQRHRRFDGEKILQFSIMFKGWLHKFYTWVCLQVSGSSTAYVKKAA